MLGKQSVRQLTFTIHYLSDSLYVIDNFKDFQYRKFLFSGKPLTMGSILQCKKLRKTYECLLILKTLPEKRHLKQQQEHMKQRNKSWSRSICGSGMIVYVSLISDLVTLRIQGKQTLLDIRFSWSQKKEQKACQVSPKD